MWEGLRTQEDRVEICSVVSAWEHVSLLTPLAGLNVPMGGVKLRDNKHVVIPQLWPQMVEMEGLGLAENLSSSVHFSEYSLEMREEPDSPRSPHFPPHRAYVFRAQSAEMKERGGNQTSGIDFFITQERIVFLDTQVPALAPLPALCSLLSVWPEESLSSVPSGLVWGLCGSRS